MKKNLLILPLLLSAMALASCGGDNSGGGLSTGGGGTSTNADLKITFFNGGYGESWIHSLADRFTAKTGKTVEIVKSEEGNCGAENYIKSGYNLSDLYIGEGILWKGLVQEGYLEDLTDVYEAEVETSQGKMKIKEFMDDSIVGNFYSQRQLKNAEVKPWAMPWTAKPNAMAYNEDILLALNHVSSLPVSAECIDSDTGKWVKPPKTMADYDAFCEDVIAFNNDATQKAAFKAGYEEKKIVPLGWCGSVNADSIGFMIQTWWAELQGLYESNYPGEGCYFDFWNFGNKTMSNVGQTIDLGVWYQTGLAESYNHLADMLIEHNDAGKATYKNTITNVYNTNLQQLQQLFVADKVSEKPVIAIASSYLENEVIKNKYIDSNLDGVQDVNFKFMNIPTIKEEEENLLYLNFSDSMIVPANASHKDVAKEFLKFMSTEDEVLNFAYETGGGIRPFDVDFKNGDCTAKRDGKTFTPFALSVLDIYENSTPFYEFPVNVTDPAGVAHVLRYGGASYQGGQDWLTIIGMLMDSHGKTPGECIRDAAVFQIKTNNLDAWKRQFKLTDITDYSKVIILG